MNDEDKLTLRIASGLLIATSVTILLLCIAWPKPIDCKWEGRYERMR
jgi:hypothetical protein